ncbi:ATP11 protein-domain-containing protein [Halteromyces radiatus]|uniref:ATP11 protein-domain-containing protein n=1 Tax=Halteromyces radiatus TaxID=101107 RepID=UPI00221E92E8|nr:ATP11 protein-domain-containing protein [Halteromyces radiatus]KAI8093189.1 ATP11 protein-domain-containing protein [Halteromyces radiatus]
MNFYKLRFSFLQTVSKTKRIHIAQSVRHAHVVGLPPSLFFTRSEQDRIRDIAKQANRFKIDYELKYADKIRQKAKRKGISVQQLKQQAKQTTKQHQQPISIPKQTPSSTSSVYTSNSTTSVPRLNDIVKLDIFGKVSKENIIKLWHEYHKDKKNTINAVIPSSIYQTIHERRQRYPMFIFPLPRDNGLEFYLLQFHDRQCYFTSLAEYKLKQDQARPFLSLTHYDELEDTKEIVLMHGHIHQPKIVDVQDAQFLAFCVQHFYGDHHNNQQLFKLVRQFHEHPDDFDYLALIAAMEKLTY